MNAAHPRLIIWLGLCLLVGVLPLRAQEKKPPAAGEEPVILKAFEVTADAADSYEAINTSGVTGTNRSIRSLPMTMNVFTRTFIDELNATDVTDLMNFTPNVTFSLDATVGGNESSEQYRLRGLTSKEERRRNGFISLSRSDSFSTERVEMLRGAQALLYGQGVSSGAINTVTKRATTGRFGEVRALFDDQGTHRFTLDYNDSRGPFSVRVAGLAGHQALWQANLKDDRNGAYIDLARSLGPRFTLRANFEYFEQTARNRNQANETTIADNSTRDRRAGQTLGALLYTGGDVSGIFIGGEPVSYKNYRSSHTMVTGQRQFANTSVVALEGALTPRLSVRLAWNLQDARTSVYKQNGVATLVAPTDSNAIGGQWSARIAPQRNTNIWHIWAGQAAAVYQFDIGHIATNQLVVGGEERLKQQLFSPGSLYAADSSGNFVAGTGNLGRKALAVFYAPVQNSYPNGIIPVPGYAWGENAAFNTVPPTPANPRGLSGSGALTLRPERQLGGYVNWLGNWFHDRVDTMVGIRYDHVKLDNAQLLQTVTETTARSGTLGAVFHVTPNLGLYVNSSTSFAAASTLSPTVDNTYTPPGTGVSREAGFKFDLLERRLSGSLAVFDNKSGNEAVNIPGAADNIVDPLGINGRNGGNGSVADVRARGVELVLTAQPAKGFRLLFSLGTNDAYISSAYFHAIFYNDQFNTDGTTVKVKQTNGTLTDLLVPSVRTNATSPKIPLTLAMLRDPASDYHATLNPVSGQITNAAALFLTTAGVGTGIAGLPISAHQLGFVAPNNGIYEVYTAGDKVTPNSGLTFSANANYEFGAGALKGLSIGGVGRWQREIRQGYATIGGTRQLFFQPNSTRLDLRLGYRLKVRKMKWDLQFTVQNVGDVQPVVTTLSATGALSLVNINQAPRTYVLSTSLKF